MTQEGVSTQPVSAVQGGAHDCATHQLDNERRVWLLLTPLDALSGKA